MMAFHFSPPSKLESRAYHVGIASTTALLDTPSSQVVDLGDPNDAATNAAGSLPGRAALIASVLTTSPLKDEIAKSAGIDPRTLIAGAPTPSARRMPAPRSARSRPRTASQPAQRLHLRRPSDPGRQRHGSRRADRRAVEQRRDQGPARASGLTRHQRRRARQSPARRQAAGRRATVPRPSTGLRARSRRSRRSSCSAWSARRSSASAGLRSAGGRRKGWSSSRRSTGSGRP